MPHDFIPPERIISFAERVEMNMNIFVTKQDVKNRWFFIPISEAERFDKINQEAFQMNDISVLEGTYYKYQIRENITIFINKPQK